MMSLMPQIFELLKEIPEGKVTTYKEISGVLKTSPRAVGKILPQNDKIPEIPCHRVVKSNGDLGGYKLGKEKKEEFLSQEGVKVVNGKINLDEHFYGFKDEQGKRE